MVNSVLNWITYGTPFTTYSTLHNLARSISNYWIKSPVKTSKYRYCSQEKSLSIPLKNVTTLWLLVQTSYLGVTSRESLRTMNVLSSSLILLIPALT